MNRPPAGPDQLEQGPRSFYVVQNVTGPIFDLRLPAGYDRVNCQVEIDGELLGMVELPAFDQFVPAYVLEDAIAAEYAWTILEKFFKKSVLPDLRFKRTENGLAAWRGGLCLADCLDDDPDFAFSEIFSRQGWTLFLQELWGLPSATNDWFYDERVADTSGFVATPVDGWIKVDAGLTLPDLEPSAGPVRVIFSVGGIPIGVVVLEIPEAGLPAHQLQLALMVASGFELCIAAVRQGILGRPLNDPGPLRLRLAEKARLADPVAPPDWGGDLSEGRSLLEGWQREALRALSPDARGVVLARRAGGVIGDSSFRRVAFPANSSEDIVELSAQSGEPVLRLGEPASGRFPIVYAPELLWSDRSVQATRPFEVLGETSAPQQINRFDRQYFELMFASRKDPWDYTHVYETIKYDQSLAMLPSAVLPRALEIGCAEGHFTERLAPKVGQLLAADISLVALARARKRCTGLGNVEFMHFDLRKDAIPGRFDLIACSEILYFMGDPGDLLAVAKMLGQAIGPDGYLLLAHANLVVDEPEQTGFTWDLPFGAKAIGETILETGAMTLVKELRTPLYRIHLFQRTGSTPPPQTERIEITEVLALPREDAAGDILWQGGSSPPGKVKSGFITDRLPILMYHRVAPEGSEVLGQYRVSPSQFEEQLRFLQDSGYYSVSFQDWQRALSSHRPLPGRAILLTFDDGYQDFRDYAWPLLDQYGFSALVFLVAGHVGGTNHWDRQFGETLPLMDWDTILKLAGAGVEFGSHSLSHPFLDRLEPTELVRELVRSRRILEKELGLPVRAFAYPHGAEDGVVRHLAGGAGYTSGFTVRPGRSSIWDHPLSLPRILVDGTQTFEHFLRNLESELV